MDAQRLASLRRRWDAITGPLPLKPRSNGGRMPANGIVNDALTYLDSHYDQFKAELIELSKIPSVSASGFPPAEVRRSAEATASVMRGHGIENVQVLEVEGAHPYVYGDWMKKAGAPT